MARRLVLAFGSSALVAATVFACSSSSFDDLQLDAGSTIPTDATSDQDTPVDSGFLPDGAPIDPTEGEIDSGAKQPDSGGCTTCDCDKDGYDRPGCGDGKGKDCDDNDPDTYPGATFGTSDKDMNCSGQIEKAFTENVSCTGLTCAAPSGFSGTTGCGKQGTFVTCKAILIVGCAVDATEIKTQLCR